MTRPARIILFTVGGIAGLAILLVVTATFLLRANLKSRVEALASEALDMDVNVGGRAAIKFLSGLRVAFADVHARKRGADVASAGEVSLGIEILPLLHREVRRAA
jgi:hypothetical protein